MPASLPKLRLPPFHGTYSSGQNFGTCFSKLLIIKSYPTSQSSLTSRALYEAMLLPPSPVLPSPTIIIQQPFKFFRVDLAGKMLSSTPHTRLFTRYMSLTLVRIVSNRFMMPLNAFFAQGEDITRQYVLTQQILCKQGRTNRLDGRDLEESAHDLSVDSRECPPTPRCA